VRVGREFGGSGGGGVSFEESGNIKMKRGSAKGG